MRPRFHPRHAPRLLAFFTSLFMSFWMSMVITYLNLGAHPGFLHDWMRAFGSAFVIAFPTILVVLPIARRIVNGLTTPPPDAV